MAVCLPKPSVHASPGEKLRYYRQIKQISQEEISRILGYKNIWYITNLEKGFNPIYYEDAVKLAGVLDIDPDDLLTEYTRFCRPGYGERIKRIRYEYRMSQAEFANLVETRRDNLSIWESEHQNIHPEYGRFLHLKMLAEQKGLDFARLIQDSEYCALPGFVDSKNEEKTERNAGYLVVSHSGGGMLRQGTRKGIRRTPANRGMRAHRIVKSLDISEDVCHGLCP